MHEAHLKLVYREYKNCLKNEFSEYFGKDDEYKSYLDKCYNQKSDIKKYYMNFFNRIFYVLPSREETEVQNQVQKRFNQFGSYGWSGPQIRNYILNYDRSKEEYDVWTNHIMARESAETHGLIKEVNPADYPEERLPVILKNLIEKSKRKSFLESYKWTGKPQDILHYRDFFGISKDIGSFN